MKIKEFILFIIAVLVLYCFIFNPPFPFLPVGIPKLFSILLFPLFLFPKFFKQYWRNYRYVTILLLSCILYTFLIKLIYSSSALFTERLVFMMFESFFTAYILAYFLLKKFKEKADIVILCVTILASIISVGLILRPDINEWVRFYFGLLQDERLSILIIYRGFGIADDLLFTYPIALSIGGCLCIHYARKNKIYYCFLPFILIGIFFNARIGVVPIFLYIVYVSFFERKLGKILQMCLGGIVVYCFFKYSGFLEGQERTIDWLIAGSEEVTSLVNDGETTGNFDALFGYMLVFPKTILGFIFGTGKDIFLAEQNSDVGYILQLNYGGLIYVLFFVSIVVALFRKLKSRIKTDYQWFSFVLLGTFLICNIKGTFFSTISGIRMLMLLFFIYTMKQQLKFNDNEELNKK